jgi:O-antigen/teichoic acid export membrane protein
MENVEIKKYLKKSMITGIGKSTLVTTVTLSLIPLIIQRIGIDNYAMVMLTLLFSSAASIIDLGISKAVTLLLGRTNETTEKNEIVSGALLINLALALGIGLIVCLLVYLEVPVFGSNFDKKEYTFLILWLGLIVMIFSLLTNLVTSILEAYFLMHYINFGFAFSSLLLYGTLYFATFFTKDLSVLLIVAILPSILSFLFYIIVTCRKTELKLVSVEKSVLKKITKVSFKFLNIGVINSLIVPVNKFLLVFITGSSALSGVFDVGLKIASSANNLLNSLSAPLFGIFSNAKVESEIYKIVKKTTLILFGAFLGGVIIYFFVKDFIAEILDANNSELIAGISILLLIGVCSTGVAEPVYRALIGTARLREAFYLKLIIPVVNIIFYLILILVDFSDLFRITWAISGAMLVGSVVMIIYYFKTKKVL